MAKASTTTPSLYTWAVLRIMLGLIFLWAFFDKVFGWGYATKDGKAWIDGVSPTLGFLKNAAKGPFADFYHNIAGNGIVDWLFMLGLLGIGLALTLGIAIRWASWAGILMMLLMWSAVLPPANNPVIDDHLVYAVVLFGLTQVSAGDIWGLGSWWSKTRLGKAMGK